MIFPSKKAILEKTFKKNNNKNNPENLKEHFNEILKDLPFLEVCSMTERIIHTVLLTIILTEKFSQFP